jgi:hypothetical protein
MDTLYSNVTPATVGDMITTTANSVNKKYHDLYFNKNVLLKWFMDNAHEDVEGGFKIVEHLEYAENSTVDFYAKGGVIRTTPNQILTDAIYDAYVQAGSATIDQVDLAKNRGEAELASLVEKREKNLMKTAALAKSRAFYYTTPTSIQPLSIPELISSSNPARGNIGNIDRDSYSWWQSNSVAMGSFGATGIAKIHSMLRLIAPAQGMDEPTLAVTTSDIFGYIENNFLNRVQLSPVKNGSLGFETIKIKNTEFVYDENCPSGYIFYLNPQYIKMKSYVMMKEKMSPYIQPQNQWTFTRLYGHLYNIVVTDPEKLGRHTGVTA